MPSTTIGLLSDPTAIVTASEEKAPRPGKTDEGVDFAAFQLEVYLVIGAQTGVVFAQILGAQHDIRHD